MENTIPIIESALREIIEVYGIETIEDVQKMNALLMDYIPHNARERKLIISAIKEDVAVDLLAVKAKSRMDQELAINRCLRRLTTEAWLSEDAAHLVVTILASILGVEAVSVLQDSITPQTQNIQSAGILNKGEFTYQDKTIVEVLRKHREIGYKAFASDIKLKTIDIPEGIKVIHSKAFLNCVNLKTIKLPSSVEYIGSLAFAGCDSLDEITLSQNRKYIMSKGLLIDREAKEVLRATKTASRTCIVPADVTTISPYSFERHPVQEIILPKGLKSVSIRSFHLCGELQSIQIDSHNAIFCTCDGVLYSRDRSVLIRFPSGYRANNYIVEEDTTEIGESAFGGARNLESITFTSSVRNIGPKAFEFCLKLSSLVLPSSIETIGERAFQYCTKLSSIMLPRGIREIGDNAFCGCTSITTISIPRSVERIGHAAFYDCSALKRIVIQDGVTFIGDGAFVGCSAELEFVIRNNEYVKHYCDAHGIKWERA